MNIIKENIYVDFVFIYLEFCWWYDNVFFFNINKNVWLDGKEKEKEIKERK